MGILTALSAKCAKPGRHGDGGGLYLLVKPSGARSWLLRVQHDGRRRDIGLGSFDPAAKRSTDDPTQDVPLLNRRVLTLAEAREKSAMLLRLAKAGRDPLAERDKERKAVPTFREALEACHKELSAGWTDRHAASFLSSLTEHALPSLGGKRVDLIEASDMRDMLAPIWTAKPVMARKVRQRAGTVLNFAKAKGWRTSEGPGKAVTFGLARHGRGGNFAAMPYADVPGFVAGQDAKADTMGRLALLFAILTAARSGEVRSARWSHVDLDGKLWHRPAEMMKSGAAHSVTLSDQAVKVLERAKALRLGEGKDPLLFPGSGNRPLSDMTLTKVLRDARQPYTVHGFRSAFRDWAAEQCPSIPDPVAEAALAHAVADKVIAAYKRTTFLEMRRKLLDLWGEYVSGGASKVVQLAMAV